MDLGLYIKLGLNYGILGLGLMKFILIYYVLCLINWAYILVINLEILDWGLWHVKYFCWVIFANLDPFWLTKFVGLIWILNLGLKIYCEFYTLMDIYIWAIFVFACAHFAILLAEYEFMTRGAWNFMEESEIRKAIGRHWTCCKLVWVHILFPTFILFYFY